MSNVWVLVARFRPHVIREGKRRILIKLQTPVYTAAKECNEGETGFDQICIFLTDTMASFTSCPWRCWKALGPTLKGCHKFVLVESIYVLHGFTLVAVSWKTDMRFVKEERMSYKQCPQHLEGCRSLLKNIWRNGFLWKDENKGMNVLLPRLSWCWQRSHVREKTDVTFYLPLSNAQPNRIV